MIRSEDVKGGDRRGGTFAVEFSDKNGKWIRGGAYPNGLRGTADWTRIEINHLKVPENTEKTGITLYLGNVHIYENNEAKTRGLLGGKADVKFELNV